MPTCIVLLLAVARQSHALALHAGAGPTATRRAALPERPRAAVRLSQRGGEDGGLVESLGESVRSAGALWEQLVGAPPALDMGGDARAAAASLELSGTATEDLEFVPLVLVVGATGRTGRIVTRKLVRQGFRVAVLVRSLSSETLNRLGSGVSYSYGDMTDYKSLLDAMEDVDKVLFAAETADSPEQELLGLGEVRLMTAGAFIIVGPRPGGGLSHTDQGGRLCSRR